MTIDEEITDFVEDLTTMKVVEDIMDVCGAAHISYYSESYRHRVNNSELVDESLILDEFIGHLVNELKQMGIEFNMEESEARSRNHYIECLVELRDRLASENLAYFFASLEPDDNRDKIVSRFLNEDSRDDGGLVWYLIEEIRARHPFHIRLNLLSQEMTGLIVSNEKFFDHVNAVIEESENLIVEVDRQDDDIRAMETYIADHQKAKERLRSAVSALKYNVDGAETLSIDNEVKRFDRTGNANMRDNVSNPAGGKHKDRDYHPASLKDETQIEVSQAAKVASFLYAFTDYSQLRQTWAKIVKSYEIKDGPAEQVRSLFIRINNTSKPLPEGGEI